MTLWKALGVPNVFTMEASFYGSEGSAKCSFTSSHFMQAGRELCRSLLYYFQLKREMPLLREGNEPLRSIPPNSGKQL